MNTNPNLTTNNCSPNQWGGVTCASGSNRDQGFLDFLSSGTDVSQNSPGVGNISCTPSNDDGFLIRLQVLMDGPLTFNPMQTLNMQPQSSSLIINVVDRPITRSLQTRGRQPITYTVPGKQGTIRGNQAVLMFQDDSGEITLRGNVNRQEFTGSFEFVNYKYWNSSGRSSGPGQGAQGRAGTFRVSTCTSFSGQ